MFGSPEPTEFLSVQNSFTNSLSAYISQNGLCYFQLHTSRYTISSYSNFLVFLLHYSFFFHKKIYSQVDLVSHISITLRKTGGIYHDRFIVLDYGTEDERIFLSGASSKDAGARVTSIVEDFGVGKYKVLIDALLKNPELLLT